MKSSNYKLIIYFIGLFCFNTANAQIQKNQSIISLGVGNNIAGIVINNFEDNTSASPCFNLSADLGQTERFSVGIGYAFDELKSIEKYYYVSNSNRVYGGDYNVIFRRNNIGARFLFHFSKKPTNDFYIGLRPSYTIVSRSIENLPANAISYNQYMNRIGSFKMKNRYSVQAILGYRYFWNESFGVTSELAIGPPYFFNLGLSLRL